MKLVSFSVSNYRSITSAHKINTEQITVLVGKNNEGKSNILRALALAMDAMKTYSENPRLLQMPVRFLKNRYEWSKDFPVSLQEKNPDSGSVFDLHFELDESELMALKHITGIRMGNAIPVRVAMGIERAKIDIPKRGTPAFKEHKQEIINFVCSKIFFNFIPAVRTENHAIRVIDDIISIELDMLENNKEYTDAVTKIEKLQQKILDNISNRIKTPLNTFLPTVKDVSIRIKKEQRRAALRRDIEVIIDDGTATVIQSKGDGIKSLTALAMLNVESRPNMISVIAIEEPESHLHPAAIHQLVEVINGLSEKNQVIITTHNPLFIYRNKLASNIIVDSGAARPARNIKEIRDILGIMPSDNLINARHVLVVEGDDDKISLTSLLSYLSPKIKTALMNNSFEIKPLCGAGNLSYELNTLRGWACRYFVYIDHDNAGVQAAEKAKKIGLLTEANVKFCTCDGQPESEFEDCLEISIYKGQILDKYSVDIDHAKFRGNRKWTERIKAVFLERGQRWDDSIMKNVKHLIAECVKENPEAALNVHKRGSIDALIVAIESILSE